MQLQELYKKRQTDFSDKAAEFKQKYIYFSIVRLVIFFIGAGVFTFLWSYGWIATFFLIVFLVVFARFVYWHQTIQQNQIHHENLSNVNQNEIDYLNFKFNQFDSGEQFMDKCFFTKN